MTEFLFVRHCETELNRRDDIVGGRTSSAPISERGWGQSELLGDYFRAIHLHPDAIYSSGAIRTHMTAMLALETAGLAQDITVDERLLEMTHGDYEGRLRTDVYTPAAIEQHHLETMDGKLPGGESVVDVQNRMWEYLTQTHDAYPDGTILIFSHGLAIRSLAGKILGQTKQQILAERTDNVSLTQITTTPDGTPYVDFIGENVIKEVE